MRKLGLGASGFLLRVEEVVAASSLWTGMEGKCHSSKCVDGDEGHIRLPGEEMV